MTLSASPAGARTAIVTGASRGIGAAVAHRLAAQGYRLVLTYRAREDCAREVEAGCVRAGTEVLLVRADVADRSSARSVCDAAVARFGRVDVLVNNAGVSHDGLLATQTDEEIEELVAVNVLGAVRLARAVLRPMLCARSGVILNISSVLATRPSRGNAVYSGTKGFIESFTRALAVEVGRKGLRVNAVAPGTIDTDMAAPTISLAGDKVRERISLGRVGSVDEVAEVVAFLASDAARYVHGAVVPVDGAFLGGT